MTIISTIRVRTCGRWIDLIQVFILPLCKRYSREEEIAITRFLYFFVWTIVIGLIFYFGMKWRFHIEEAAGAEFKLLPVVLFSVIFPVVLGGLLRLPQLMIEIRENKKWTFDWPKFAAAGLPSLLILILYIIPYSGIVPVLHFIFVGGSMLITVAGVVFGYVLLDSLKK